MPRKTYAGPYENMEFPPYQFREYPKMVHRAGKPAAVVNSHSEEVALIAMDPETRVTSAADEVTIGLARENTRLHEEAAESAAVAKAAEDRNAQLEARLKAMEELLAQVKPENQPAPAPAPAPAPTPPPTPAAKSK